ncbi:MAG: hypothetical protein ABFC96_04225 [Thermoguttaceae bacterium]
MTTGVAQRVWKWTGKGLVTTGFRDLRSGRQWATASHRPPCDWSLPSVAGVHECANGELVAVDAHLSDDDGFGNKFVEVVSTVRYEQERLEIQHVVWAIPGAPGLRTQLRVKALSGFNPARLPEASLPPKEQSYSEYGGTFLKPSARSEFLPLDFSVKSERVYWGYYNDPGNRHDQFQDMLKEQTVKGWPIFLREDIDWASGMAVKYGDAGVVLVKESPKCVNQPAHNTGASYANPSGLCITGWGLTPNEIVPDRFRQCWANWCIVYQGGDDGIQLALKQFDAARYPVFPARDMLLLSNTWGPGCPDGAPFADEDFVLREVPLLADLGIDVLQIDDGWQRSGGGPNAARFLPKYKNGWKDIKAACDKAGLRLGLWVAIQNANVADLNRNLDELGFLSWKADYDHLASRSDYERRTAEFREVMKHAWMRTQFALCPEYDDPRYGWYFAREYGAIFFQNNGEAVPAHVAMVPFHVLRQNWLMAKYFPANKLQVMLQNPKRLARFGDARQHGCGYCFAMGLPFVPCFFQAAQFLDNNDRRELKELIRVYKNDREDIFTSLTYPIGDLPDNSSWSGFQMTSSRRDGGHLLLFRELHNEEASRSVRLKFLAGKKITLEDLQSRQRRTLRVPNSGEVEFEIQQPADYRFYRYTVD